MAIYSKACVNQIWTRSKPNKFLFFIFLFLLLQFFLIFIILQLFQLNDKIKLKLDVFDIVLNQNNYYETNNLEPIDSDTANQEHEYDIKDFKSLKKSLIDKKHINPIDDLSRNFVEKFKLPSEEIKYFKSMLTNFSNEIRPKNDENKVAISFRFTNIYRIDLNCFWTMSLNLFKNFKFEYNYNRSSKLCHGYIDNKNKVENTTPEMIAYIQKEIRKKSIKIDDNNFLPYFPTNETIKGGAWFPGIKKVDNYNFLFELNEENCVPKERIAILVSMKNREENLNTFLIYMHYFLQKQRIAYKIFVIEQSDGDHIMFNKGRLYNIGFKYVIENEKEWEFNCIFLHDIDLLPTNFNLEYSCSDMPKHMSIHITRLSDKSLSPHYRFLTGGVLSLRLEHFMKINGYSNEYFGWGGGIKFIIIIFNYFISLCYSRRR